MRLALGCFCSEFAASIVLLPLCCIFVSRLYLQGIYRQSRLLRASRPIRVLLLLQRICSKIPHRRGTAPWGEPDRFARDRFRQERTKNLSRGGPASQASGL